MKLEHDIWVLVADGEKFLLLRNLGHDVAPQLQVISREEIDNPPTREQGTGKPGRFDPGGFAEGAIGPSAVQETDWHRLEKTRFAEEVATRLRGWALENRFDRLILAAPPQTLGVLRANLHKEVQRRLVAEINKDLTNHPVDAIERHLQEA